MAGQRSVAVSQRILKGLRECAQNKTAELFRGGKEGGTLRPTAQAQDFIKMKWFGWSSLKICAGLWKSMDTPGEHSP
jgi:hypothetical protein